MNTRSTYLTFVVITVIDTIALAQFDFAVFASFVCHKDEECSFYEPEEGVAESGGLGHAKGLVKVAVDVEETVADCPESSDYEDANYDVD